MGGPALSKDSKLSFPQPSLLQADAAPDSPVGAEVGFGRVCLDGGRLVGVEC